MKRLVSIFLTLLCCVSLYAQTDSSKVFMMDGLLEEYYRALQYSDTEIKKNECDLLIRDVSDSLMKRYAALKLYAHYMESPVMGDEAVAIHIFERWFASREIVMKSEADFLNASVFAEFNKRSLIGSNAPELTLRTPEGGFETLPGQGSVNVLYFYDTNCAKCKIESLLLSYVMKEASEALDFYAVYVGDNESEWKKYRNETLNFDSAKVKMHHLWDPELESAFQKAYGVLSTPTLLLVDCQGKVLGRRLDAKALNRLLPVAFAQKELYDRCPSGSAFPNFRMNYSLKYISSCPFVSRKVREKTGTINTAAIKGRPAYVVFHTSGCSVCSNEIQASLKFLESAGRGTKIFYISVDEFMAENSESELARLFDTFDLTRFPYIVKLDEHGTVRERYCSFVK